MFFRSLEGSFGFPVLPFLNQRTPCTAKISELLALLIDPEDLYLSLRFPLGAWRTYVFLSAEIRVFAKGKPKTAEYVTLADRMEGPGLRDRG